MVISGLLETRNSLVLWEAHKNYLFQYCRPVLQNWLFPEVPSELGDVKGRIKKSRPYLKRHCPKRFYVILFNLPPKSCIVIFILEMKSKLS